MPTTTYRDVPDTFVEHDDVTLAMRVVGPQDGPPLLLIGGLGEQLVSWRPELVDGLVAAGLRVAIFDNRDAGRSTHVDAPRANLPQVLAGDHTTVAYTLDDLARDAVAILDHLGWDTAHVAGNSMGGMIAQLVAIDHAERTRSLTSIFSTPHATIGVGTPEAIQAILAPPPATREEHEDQTVRIRRVIGSRTHPLPEDELRAQANLEYDRANHPVGVARQFAAIQVAPDRTTALGDVTMPVLVIHGDEDTLIQPSGGEATVAAVPGARHVVVAGMGHDYPAEVVGEVIDAIVSQVTAVESA